MHGCVRVHRRIATWGTTSEGYVTRHAWLQELVPSTLQQLVEIWDTHASHALATVYAVNAAAAVEADARAKREAAESCADPSSSFQSSHE